MERFIIETTYEQPLSGLNLPTLGNNWPSVELEQLLTHLKQELEQGRQLLSEQEEELTEYELTIAELEEKLRKAPDSELLTLEMELVKKRQKKEKLAERLTLKRRYLQMQEVFMEQYRELLDNKPFNPELIDQNSNLDVKFPGFEAPEPLNSSAHTKTPKKPWWRWTVIIPIVGLLVGVVVKLPQSQLISQQLASSLALSPSSSPVASNAKPTLKAVAALGYLEPKGEVIQVSAPAMMDGLRVDKLLVKEGDSLKAGQKIAILDNYDRLSAALRQANSQVKIAQARLAQVLAGAKSGEITAQKSKFEGSQAELEGQINTQKATIADLEAQLQGEKSAQIATIQGLKAQLDNATSDCQRYEFLYQSGGVSQQSRDSVCLKQKTTLEQVNEAQANLKRIITSRQEQIQQAHANLQRTIETVKSQINADKATLQATAQVRPEDIEVAKAELESAKTAVDKAKADLKLAYVTSPKDGQILKIHTWAGEMVSRDQGIVELGQTSQMYVTAEVYETDITRVKVGQPAIITANGVTKQLKGTVDKIGLQIGRKNVLGTDPVADADARVVEVKIRLNAQDSQRVAHLTNLQVNVIINPSN
ncbi:ABC exporter membrane fusion protein [Gloeothece verrucosa]|uniref:ABC exporter membrane fusion protein, DevB family n=1 Tax=Gloeothece verrucosa (strain PCC 7822) TaxID=497965 RepID=E0UH36_GLOV7|nr:ABC exporter membrane fusion protein [Gloeothece verrucosa]ADN15635.1 ABC exporter membrane fusion protein, DevB family [Gloeothece verrucosa PCC 7822]